MLEQQLEQLALAGADRAALGSTSQAGNAFSGGPSAALSSGGAAGTSAGARPKSKGKGSRGPRPRLFRKGECQADGCAAELAGLPRYHLRNHICVAHKTADAFARLGVQVRFCQRCGVAHPLADFDGLKKSCRRMLEVHNQRRRKAGSAPAAAATASPSASAPAAASGPADSAPTGPQPAAQAAQQLLQAQQAPAGEDMAASPSVSVGSAALSAALALPEEDGWAGWLLGDGGSGGADPPGDPLQLPASGEAVWADSAEELLGGAGVSAGAGAGPANERVCCAAHERVCGAGVGPRPAAAAAGEPAAVAAAGPRADAAVGGSAAGGGAAGGGGGAGGLGAAPLPAASSSAGVGGATDDGAGDVSSADCGALAQLQQSAPLLYQLFVQQQLLASQALLATAGAVLSTRLPLAAQPASSSAC